MKYTETEVFQVEMEKAMLLDEILEALRTKANGMKKKPRKGKGAKRTSLEGES